jgi:GR25 family glycosyltransferase involved in LPS biosynthesis
MINLLENVLYINLEGREDRRQHFEKEWSKVKNESATRIPAILMKQGAIGCTLSHIRALEYAKSRGWSHVLICEDDFTVLDASLLLGQLEKFSNRHKDDWDVLLLGGNNWPPFEGMDESCLRVHHCLSTMAYVVRQHYFDTLLENFREGVQKFIRAPDKPFLYSIDIWWRRLQIRDRWFLLQPCCVIQWEGDWSDVENKNVNYSFLMRQQDKREIWNQSRNSSQGMRKMEL